MRLRNLVDMLMFKKADYISNAERKGSFQPFTSRDLMLVLLVQVLALNETRMIFFSPMVWVRDQEK